MKTTFIDNTERGRIHDNKYAESSFGDVVIHCLLAQQNDFLSSRVRIRPLPIDPWWVVSTPGMVFLNGLLPLGWYFLVGYYPWDGISSLATIPGMVFFGWLLSLGWYFFVVGCS
jgi:hypothetical protein